MVWLRVVGARLEQTPKPGDWTPELGSYVNAMGVTFEDGARAVAAALAVDTRTLPSNCEGQHYNMLA